jgi:hypothetical protein
MKRNTSIKHKEATIVCEENEPINMSYNILLTTPKANAGVKHITPTVTAKSTLTYTNCGKIGHLVETYNNMKRKIPTVPTITVKSIKLVKSRKIFVHYPYIICFNIEHRSE